jgi:hypothetical protein
MAGAADAAPGHPAAMRYQRLLVNEHFIFRKVALTLSLLLLAASR